MASIGMLRGFGEKRKAVMGKRAIIVTAAVAGVLLLGATAAIAGPLVYRDFIAEPAAETPTLRADDGAFASSDEIDPSSLNGTWVVAEGSFAGYRVDEVLNGTDVTVTGRTSQVTGTLTVEEVTLQAATFEVDVASIATSSSHRDDYFRENTMRVSTYPTATFTLTSPVKFTSIPGAGDVVDLELSGSLTLAGVTAPVTFTAQARGDATSAEIVGQIAISFSDFGITAPSLGFVVVENVGFVEFDLVIERG